MAAYITVGAKTSHGGTVISGSPHTTHNGIPISRKGDKVICKKCKKVTTILSGDACFIVDGAPIARGSDVTSCGAKLIAVQQAFAESDFSVSSIAQAAALVFPKSDPDALFASLTASDNSNVVYSSHFDNGTEVSSQLAIFSETSSAAEYTGTEKKSYSRCSD
ncbi:PAAR domain-containing protein [Psychrobacter glaciei]|uniref:PAAR domain-containing protein n=1 Tax=Psychrobacter glaciei TaxID=619771 RepID=UPI001F06BC34|nr:PAAR domain-containing protein [Psychrobacter glaciei]MCH1782894.1 PAAR domain-containing protein [Psychrobacter glaciei]